MKRAFNSTERLLVVVLALLIIGAAYYFLVHQNVQLSLDDIQGQKDMLETELMVAQAKVQKMQSMQQELDAIEKSGKKSVVPEYDNLSQELIFLYNILNATSDYTINIASVTTTSGVARRVMNLSFTSASYESCCRIIEKLQNCKYCCRLGDVTMEPIREYVDQFSYVYNYGYDADYSILRNPLSVNVSMTFFEKVAE